MRKKLEAVVRMIVSVSVFATVFRTIPSEFWIFASGIIGGIAINLFTEWAISDIGATPCWKITTVIVLLMASAFFGFYTGIVRQGIERNWSSGGSHPEDWIKFMKDEATKVLVFPSLALLFLAAGLIALWWR